MKKILRMIGKIFAVIFGTFFLLCGVCGIVMCFVNEAMPAIVSFFVALFYFLLGILLFFVAFKKPKNKKQNDYSSKETQNIKISSDGNDFYDTYEKVGNVIQRLDGKDISDDEIPTLIQASYEEALKAEEENPKFHRTEHEDELSFNFEMKYGHTISELQNNFESLYRNANRENDLNKRIEMLNESINAFNKAKKFCYSKGKGGTIYFQDMWECMSNSRNSCFSYLDNIEDSLDEAIFMRDVAIPKVKEAISNNDGILQKDIYKFIPEAEKSEVQKIIRDMESRGEITRTKKSNSYELHIV